MSARRLVTATFCTAVGALAFASAPASALVGEREFSASFGAPGTGNGQFSSPAGVAVSEAGSASGDVYVVDAGNNRVERFSSTGAYIGKFDGSGTFEVEPGVVETGTAAPTGAFSSPEAIAVDNNPDPLVDESSGDVYVADRGHGVVDKFSATGAYLGQLASRGDVYGVAVDTNGVVWVYWSSGEIDAYSNATTNALLSGRGSGAMNRVEPGFAVDSEDNFYVVHEGFRLVAKLNSAGEVIGSRAAEELGFGGINNATGVAVELSSNAVFIDSNGGVLEEFAADGSPLGSLGGEQLDAGRGLAVSSTSGNVYVADAGLDVVHVFVPVRGAGISSESALNVLSGSATLQARINPDGTPTTYHFEYDTTPYANGVAHGTSVPVPNVDIGSGISAVAVSQPVQGLQPGTVYHYRVVAVSEVSSGSFATVDGADRVLTTSTADGQLPGSARSEGCANERLRAEQPYGSLLPDCRAYEMVSPLDKNDQSVARGEVRAAVSGDAVTYISSGAFAGPAGEVSADRYLAGRGPAGWSNRNITPPSKAFETSTAPSFEGLFFTPDLAKGLLRSIYFPLTSGSPEGYINLYVADTGGGAYQAVTGPPPGVGPYRQSPEGASPEPVGVSRDMSRVVFEERFEAALTPGASPNHRHVYEWANGRLSLVDEPPPGVTFGAEDWAGSPRFGYYFGDVWHAVSSDGSRVFFTAGDAAGPGGYREPLGQLYVREVD
jgi:hypothetical protein